ncbi:MAG: 50S ribosomal protein L21 [Planctomycetes bacterium]|nr:50S ribosomal protein L21 [Planctomycetota bacterium]
MFAVISDRNRQIGVRVGDVVACDLNVDWKEGEAVTFERVLLISNEGQVHLGKPTVVGAKVQAKVLGAFRGVKTVSMRFKRRKNVRRKQGHREGYTRVEITGIQA